MSLVRSGAPALGALPAMRRLTAATICALLLGSTAAAAKPARGLISGRLINAASQRPLSGIEVSLLRASDDQANVRTTRQTTDAEGRYSFRRLPAGSSYALEATYDGGLFVGETIELGRGERRNLDLEVWPTTSDPQVISIRRDDIFLVQGEQGVGVLESVVVVNHGDRAYVGRGTKLDGTEEDAPTLGFSLPRAARDARVDIVDSEIDRLYAVPSDFGFAATVAIPPGETTTTFTYLVEGSGGSYDITRTALYPIAEVNVYTAQPLAIEAGLFERDGEINRGRRYTRWTTPESFAAGDPVSVLAVAQHSSRTPLYTGVVLGLVAIALLAGLALVRWSTRSRRVVTAPGETRDHLVTAIAELDLRHQSGAVDDDEWARRRTALKARLERMPGETPR